MWEWLETVAILYTWKIFITLHDFTGWKFWSAIFGHTYMIYHFIPINAITQHSIDFTLQVLMKNHIPFTLTQGAVSFACSQSQTCMHANMDQYVTIALSKENTRL